MVTRQPNAAGNGKRLELSNHFKPLKCCGTLTTDDGVHQLTDVFCELFNGCLDVHFDYEGWPICAKGWLADRATCRGLGLFIGWWKLTKVSAQL